PIPSGARVTHSWRGRPGDGEGSVEGGAVVWSDISVAQAETLEALAYRITPVAGTDGARIFWDAVVQPSVAWMLPSAGQATARLLPLNGLWGEGGLRRTMLSTLLTVFTRERADSGTVTLMASVRAGSRDENDVTRGGSHWLEHAHFLGTTRRP